MGRADSTSTRFSAVQRSPGVAAGAGTCPSTKGASCDAPSVRTLPARGLVFDVYRHTVAERQCGRTADGILDLLRRWVGAHVNPWSGRRDGSAAGLSAGHFDAHWRIDVCRQPRDELIHKAELRLDLRCPVGAL